MKKFSLYAMTVLYIVAGINHFINQQPYRNIMPWWLPLHDTLIDISGVCEIVFGVLLIFTATRRVAAWCIIALLVAIFPANVQMMFNYLQENNPLLWLAVLRLPLQIVLIWWAYSFTKPVEA